MTELIFIIFFGTPQLHNYTCTVPQLKTAREVFIPCRGETYFDICYEASIFEYCELNL